VQSLGVCTQFVMGTATIRSNLLRAPAHRPGMQEMISDKEKEYQQAIIHSHIRESQI